MVKVKKTKTKVKAKPKKEVKKVSAAKMAEAQQKAIQSERDALFYDARIVRALMETLLLGFFTKIVSANPKIGREPLVYSNYLKTPLMNLFAGFENQMLQERQGK